MDVKIEASTRERGAHGSMNTWKARVGGSFELASLRSTWGERTEISKSFQRSNMGTENFSIGSPA